MNLKDAIANFRKTGEPFRRQDWSHGDWLIVDGHARSYGGGEICYQSNYERWNGFYVSDLTSDDWISRETKPAEGE